MRILLDNCVPADLAPHVRGHEISTAAQMGWAELEDGPLLEALVGNFDVLLTVDKSMRFQQMIADKPFAVVVLRARVNRVGELARLIPALLKILSDLQPGDVREIAVNH